MPHAVRRRAIAVPLTLIIPPIHAQDEVRATWVVRTLLASPSAILGRAQSAQRHGSGVVILSSCDGLPEPALGPRDVYQAGRAVFQL